MNIFINDLSYFYYKYIKDNLKLYNLKEIINDVDLVVYHLNNNKNITILKKKYTIIFSYNLLKDKDIINQIYEINQNNICINYFDNLDKENIKLFNNNILFTNYNFCINKFKIYNLGEKNILKKKYNIPSDVIVLGSFVSNCDNSLKNINFLIDIALYFIKKKNKNIFFIITGNNRSNFIDLCKINNIKYIYFEPNKVNKNELYGCLDFHVITSNNYEDSIEVIECALSKTQCISNNNIYSRKILDSKLILNGLSIDAFIEAKKNTEISIENNYIKAQEFILKDGYYDKVIKNCVNEINNKSSELSIDFFKSKENYNLDLSQFNVCICSYAKYMDELQIGKKIDKFDKVVRINNGINIINKKVFGEKANIFASFFFGGKTKMIEKTYNDMHNTQLNIFQIAEKRNVEKIIYLQSTQSAKKLITENLKNSRYFKNIINNNDCPLICRIITTGLATIIRIIKSKPKKLFICGFDFTMNIANGYNDIYVKNRPVLGPQRIGKTYEDCSPEWHSTTFERYIFKKLYEKYHFNVDRFLFNMLNNINSAEYDKNIYKINTNCDVVFQDKYLNYYEEIIKYIDL